MQSPFALLQRFVRLCSSFVQPKRVAYPAPTDGPGSPRAQCRGGSPTQPHSRKVPRSRLSACPEFSSHDATSVVSLAGMHYTQEGVVRGFTSDWFSGWQGGEMVMELGWLMGHLVYVRGLLPELFGALAEVQPPAPKPEQAGACGGVADGEGEAVAKARLDPLQCVLLELLSEEMEHGSTGQQLKCAAARHALLLCGQAQRELTQPCTCLGCMLTSWRS